MKLRFNNLEFAYEVHGTSGSWVTFSHSLGCSQSMWSRQIDALSRSHRVLAYDLRGHGDSDVDTSVGSLDHYAMDVVALLNALGIESTHFVGLSIGGMIGQTLAIEAPNRVSSLVLANTTAFMPPVAAPMWQQRMQLALEKGVACLASPSMERWFPSAFRNAHPEVIADLEAQFSKTTIQGYVSCCQAIMNLDTRDGLAHIHCPTLIVGGSEDPGAPVEALRQMNALIRNSELLVLEGAGHLSNIDQPEQFTMALKRFLETQ